MAFSSLVLLLSLALPAVWCLSAPEDPAATFTLNQGVGPQPVYMFCGTQGAQNGAQGNAQRNADGCGKIPYYVNPQEPSKGAIPVKAEAAADHGFYPVEDKTNPLLKRGFKEYKFQNKNELQFRNGEGKIMSCAFEGGHKRKDSYLDLEFKCDEEHLKAQKSQEETAEDTAGSHDAHHGAGHRFRRTAAALTGGTAAQAGSLPPPDFRNWLWQPVVGDLKTYFGNAYYAINHAGLWIAPTVGANPVLHGWVGFPGMHMGVPAPGYGYPRA